MPARGRGGYGAAARGHLHTWEHLGAGRPYLSPVTHNGAEDAGRGDGGLIERVPEGLPAAPVDREVLHVDRVLRGDRLHGQETGGEAD